MAKVDFMKVGMMISRVLIAASLIYLGSQTFTEPGERTYNKYIHAVRKMQMPNSKPGDVIFANFTMDQLNKWFIQAMGCFMVCAGILILAGRKAAAGVLVVVVSVFMMVSKDNFKLNSSVAAIEREKPMRLENFLRDLSLIGAGLVLIGGLGGEGLDIYEDENKVE